VVRLPVPASRWFGTDTATVSKFWEFRSPYIACPFQPTLASVEGYAKTPPCKAREDIRKYNQDIIQDTILVPKSLRNVGRTHKLDKQGGEIHDQDKIIERIEELFTELYDSEQSTIICIDPKEVSEITNVILGGGSNTTRYEERDINRQRPYKHQYIANRRKYYLVPSLNAYEKDEYPQRWKKAKMVMIFKK